MAFIRGMNKARCLSDPLWQISVTADVNKEEGNVAFGGKDEGKKRNIEEGGKNTEREGSR